MIGIMLWLGVSAAALGAYLPGLRGPFLFDDFANLPVLGSYGPIDTWDAFLRFITSGAADPTGRPLTLLTFLIDAHNWPADPWAFKRTNLVLHLINGGLLTLLLMQLGYAWVQRLSLTPENHARARQRVQIAALLGSAMWLLHPLMVSTTLYVIQREAMLPATFTMLGLLAWIRARAALIAGRLAKGVLLAIIGPCICTLAGVLSKANGVLIPLLALAVEWILLGPLSLTAGCLPAKAARIRKLHRMAVLALLVLPSAILVFWLLYNGIPSALSGNTHGRPWTVGQRLLTEPRVLLDYLRLLWLPRAFTPGLFNDQIRASTSLFDPLGTLPCIILISGLVAAGFALRRRYPPISLAILFFFAGQLLESSFISLELYFEHRNYLPAMMMFWPLALAICGVPLRLSASRISDARKVVRVLASVALLAGLGLMTHARAELWGNAAEQALLWARLNPESARAQANAAQVLISRGRGREVLPTLRTALSHQPNQVQLALNLFAAACQTGSVSSETFKSAELALKTTADPGTLLAHWFGRAIDNAEHPACPQADLPHLQKLLDALGENASLMQHPGRRQDVDYLHGRIALAQKQPGQALGWFDRALEQQPRETAAFQQAALLGSAGYPRLGLAHLDFFERLPPRPRPTIRDGMPYFHMLVLEHQHYWAREYARLRSTLEEDAAAQTAPGSGGSPR